MNLFDFDFTNNELDNVGQNLNINSNDVIDGTPNNDNLNGGFGNDTLTGKDGDDTLNAGIGNDLLNGDAGNDILSAGIGNDELAGGEGNDTLNAGIGNDILNGDAGNDVLNAGIGSDNITGGLNADSFVFVQPFVQSELNNVNSGTIIIDGQVISEIESPIGVITDFNTSEGDKILITDSSIAPGDTNALQFDNSTGILSLGGEQIVEIVSGVDSDVLANTEIIENNDSVAVGGDGGDATNGGVGSDGGDATAGDGETVIGTGGVDSNNDTSNIYRFFNSEQGSHFYTSSEGERDTLLQQIDDGGLSYSYEGESFAALTEDDDGDPLTGAKPVYRFLNNLTGAHLYTISEVEKDNIVDNLSNYNLEGVAYYAYDEPQEDTIPLYRLYNSESGTHLFTPSATEKDTVLDILPSYSIEGGDGIAFYVLPVDS